jgi:hypothetical protein
MADHVVKFGIRTITPNDFNWVVSSWRNDFRKNGRFGWGMTNEVYHRNYREVIMNTMKWTPCYVAYDLEAPDVTLGFICGGIFNGYPVIHYIYVKNNFRGFGLAGALLEHFGLKPKMPIIATHSTKMIEHMFTTKTGVLYNPFLLFKEFRDEIAHGPSKEDAVYSRSRKNKTVPRGAEEFAKAGFTGAED